MTKGTEEGVRWCIRAKMNVDNPNKALRDPVIYRIPAALPPFPGPADPHFSASRQPLPSLSPSPTSLRL